MIRMSPLEVEVNRLNVNFIRTNNEKIELVVVLIILGILGLHFTFIAQPQETPKDPVLSILCSIFHLMLSWSFQFD